MIDRDLTEIDVRQMPEDASRVHADFKEGRWVVTSFHAGRTWEIVVEPDEIQRVLVVITAYPVIRGRRR